MILLIFWKIITLKVKTIQGNLREIANGVRAQEKYCSNKQSRPSFSIFLTL